MFSDVLFGVLPLFFVMLIGYAVSFAPKFPPSVEPALNVFVFYVALPALLFKVVATAEISQGIPLDFLSAVIIATLVFAVLAWVFFRYAARQGLAQSLASMLTMSFGNVSYLGIPVILGVMGIQAGLAAGMGQLIHNVIFMVGFPVLAQLLLAGRQTNSHKPSGRRIVLTIRNALLFSPVTWSMLFGGAVLIFSLPIPKPIGDTVDLLAGAAAPGALFVIGMSLRRTIGRSIERRRKAYVQQSGGGIRVAAAPVRQASIMAVLVLGKLVALPLLTVASLHLLAPDLPPIWFNTAVLMAAMPTSATAYIMAQNDTGDGEATALAIVITCVLSVLALPLMSQLLLI